MTPVGRLEAVWPALLGSLFQGGLRALVSTWKILNFSSKEGAGAQGGRDLGEIQSPNFLFSNSVFLQGLRETQELTQQNGFNNAAGARSCFLSV